MTLDNTKTEASSIWLYHYPGTRSVRARWMLEELAVPHVLAHMELRQGAHKAEDYLKIHPLGKVPALRIDGTVIFESLATCLYLADRNWQKNLAPVPEETIQRANYYKWMAFSTSTLEPAIIEQMRLQKAIKLGSDPIDMGPTLTPFENAARYVEQILKDHSFLLGEQFSAADIMNGSLMMWASGIGLLDEFKNTRAWIEKLQTRAAYQRATSDQ